MICDVFTAATCSRLVNQTPTHTDEPHLRGAGALLQIHPAAQQEAAVAIVTARSTGGVCGSESVHWHSFLLKRWCYTAVCLLFAIQEVFTPALKDGLTHNFVTLEVRVCGERLGNSRIFKKRGANLRSRQFVLAQKDKFNILLSADDAWSKTFFIFLIQPLTSFCLELILPPVLTQRSWCGRIGDISMILYKSIWLF